MQRREFLVRGGGAVLGLALGGAATRSSAATSR
jgi:hypothetical protein